MKIKLLYGLLLTSACCASAIAAPIDDAIAIYVKKDYPAAARALAPLAAQGNAFAQTLLGEMYLAGNGVSVDNAEAAHWITLGANQGLATAQDDLGQMYYSGTGVKQSYTDALRLYTLAAQQGDANAQYKLGEMYFSGTGTSLDYAQALSWFQLAAKQNSSDAIFSLGFMYRAGLGVEQNYANALVFLQEAAKLGNIGAQTLLGVMYREGQGTPQDYAQALQYFRAAAQQGGYSAAANLGEMHFNGQGGPKDFVRAYMWESIAASGMTGDDQKETIAERDQSARLLTPSQLAEAQAMSQRCEASSFKDCGEGTTAPPSTGQSVEPRASKPVQVAKQSEKVSKAPDPPRMIATGSGFFVSQQGQVVTAAHVVAGCGEIRSPQGGVLKQIAVDRESDLALLSTKQVPVSFARLQGGMGARLGEQIVVVGFPLHGLLSEDPIVTTGTISALAGLGNDRRDIQISAPVQAGNSGGPLIGQNGSVVGVIVGKLDAIKLAKATGNLAENVNFAVSLGTLQSFLNANGVSYTLDDGKVLKTSANIASEAIKYSLLLECWKE